MAPTYAKNCYFKSIIYALLIYLLDGRLTSSVRGWDEIDTSKLERYLVDTLVVNRNESNKYIVNVLWKGLAADAKSQLRNETLANAACLDALEEYVYAVVDIPELWAVKMYDASSGVPPGFLTGNIQEIGSFDQCVSVTNEKHAYVGQYCNVRVNDSLSPFLSGSLEGVQVTYAVCVPSLCTPDDIEAIVNVGAKRLRDGNGSDKRGEEILKFPLVVDEKHCFTRVNRRLDPFDWYAILVFSVLVTVCLLSTMYDVYQEASPKSKLQSIVLSFSIKRNGGQLLATVKSRDSMDCIFGLRFFTIMSILLVHRFSQLRTAPAMGLFQFDAIVQHWSRAPITNAYISVDTFFVVSGALMSYTFLKKIDKEREHFNVFRFYLHRYFRITPAFAGMILFYATISDLFCQGPMCAVFNDTIKKPCVKNWWASLLYISNYYDSDNICMVQTWYLSVDMQLFALSPVLLYPMMRRPKVVPYLIGALYALAVIISLVQPYYNHIAAGYFIVGKTEDHRIFLDNYIMTHTRFGSWVLGFALGTYLDKFKRNPKSVPRLVVAAGWTLASAGFAGVIFGILPFQQAAHEYDPIWDTAYKSLHRHVWALSMCWLIFACSTGHGGFVNTFLSWDVVFQPLGRLTYCVYLVHILIMKLQMGAQRTPVNFTDITRITTAFGDALASTFAATILFLLFEAPGCALERIFLGPDAPKKKKEEAQTERGMELADTQQKE